MYSKKEPFMPNESCNLNIDGIKNSRYQNDIFWNIVETAWHFFCIRNYPGAIFNVYLSCLFIIYLK